MAQSLLQRYWIHHTNLLPRLLLQHHLENLRLLGGVNGRRCRCRLVVQNICGSAASHACCRTVCHNTLLAHWRTILRTQLLRGLVSIYFPHRIQLRLFYLLLVLGEG